VPAKLADDKAVAWEILTQLNDCQLGFDMEFSLPMPSAGVDAQMMDMEAKRQQALDITQYVPYVKMGDDDDDGGESKEDDGGRGGRGFFSRLGRLISKKKKKGGGAGKGKKKKELPVGGDSKYQGTLLIGPGSRLAFACPDCAPVRGYRPQGIHPLLSICALHREAIARVYWDKLEETGRAAILFPIPYRLGSDFYAGPPNVRHDLVVPAGTIDLLMGGNSCVRVCPSQIYTWAQKDVNELFFTRHELPRWLKKPDKKS
jgi:hypothetical protein